MIKIGSTTINTNVFLAPLSGCSDIPFRLIAREHGARFCFYEMVDANSIVRDRSATYRILKKHENDSPIAAQLLGREPGMMLDAARKIVEFTGTPFLDINCACPAKKVIKKKAGAHLLRDAGMLFGIVKKLASGLKVPVTVKMRIGFDSIDMPHITKVAAGCEASGAAALFVHGRTVIQGYAGGIDYASIRAIKDAVRVPVFGIGNILNAELAKKMFDETGCDGIMVARGAFGNPWIFSDIEDYLKNGKLIPSRSLETRKAVLKKHLTYIDMYKDLTPVIRAGIMRKVSMWYLTGFPAAKRIRAEISKARDHAGLLKVIDAIDHLRGEPVDFTKNTA